MFGISVTRLVIYGVIAAAVIAAGYMLWDSIYEKGKNFVYAQDNAARVKAQEQQTAADAVRIRDQQKAIADMVASGNTVKEKIRVVPGPCIKDGTDDPSLGDLSDWLCSRPGYNCPPNDRPTPQGTLPAARAPVPKR